ncbi:MAG TPA: hypothetical protein VKR53_08455 [Puia sp.]|nr:hypothetical protein [Puia sp.]
MLAKEAEDAFNDDQWIFEIKWEGYRVIAEITDNAIKLCLSKGISFEDICDEALTERKKLLRKILKETNVIKYSDHIFGEGISFFNAAQEQGLEGIMGKKANGYY